MAQLAYLSLDVCSASFQGLSLYGMGRREWQYDGGRFFHSPKLLCGMLPDSHGMRPCRA